MIELPIAERELRVAARSYQTYTSRRNTAAVAALVFFWLYWMLGMHGGAAGVKVFGALSLLCFIYTLFAGVILTSDCVSAEKREGTLGILFLTSLKSYDIVAGNILATSLKAFYGLLAAFPILGISFVMGGVSYGEFGRVCLTLISTLIFSLAFSLFVSCLSEKHLIATTRAAIGLLFFSVMLPVACNGLRKFLTFFSYNQTFVEVLELFSPSLALARSNTPSFALQRDFWWSMLIINLMSSGFLGLSCFALPRVWKDRTTAPRKWIWFQRFRQRRYGRIALSDVVRTCLLNRNPFGWLASRQSLESAKFLLGSLALCFIAWFIARYYLIRFIGGKFPEFAAQTVTWAWAGIAMHAVLLFKFAALSSQRFAEDRKSGALELLLVTPLTVRQILRGQWLALRRQLGGPVLAVIFIHGLIFWAFLIFCGMQEGIPGGAWDVLKTLWSSLSDFSTLVEPLCIGLIIVGSAITLSLNWIALGWAGMWVGLRTRRPAIATWLTLALVVLPPLPIFAGILLFADWMGFSQNFDYWARFCFFVGFGLELINSFALIGWCWQSLRRKFRTAAADRFQTPVRRQRVIAIRIARRFGFGTAAAILLVVIFYNEERWRGLNAWHQLQKEFAAHGQMLTTKPVIPPSVPEAENFGAAAIFKPLFEYELDGYGGANWKNNPARQSLLTVNVVGQERDRSQKTGEPRANWALQQSIDLSNWQRFYRTNIIFASAYSTGSPARAVLKVLKLFDPPLNEIERLSRLPYSRFPIHYEENWGAYVPHRTLFKQVAEILALRAAAKLELGENDEALADIEFCFHLAEAFKLELGIHPRIVRQNILRSALQPVWEGLAQHRWNEANLRRLQKLLQIDILQEYPRALREEIIMTADVWNLYSQGDQRLFRQMGFSDGIRSGARFYPSGWKYLNQSGLFRLCEHDLIPLVHPAEHRVFVPNEEEFRRTIRHSGVVIDPFFHLIVAPIGKYLPFCEPLKRFTYTQVCLDEVLIACALERWHQSHGEFPSRLETLMPDYLAKLPIDPINGESYKYRLLPDAQFLLYSIGWNGRDDGGKTLSDGGNPPEIDLNNGDWVWTYDQPAQLR